MVRKIKEEEEIATRIKIEREEEDARRAEQARLAREAEARRLVEERLARAAAAEAKKAARLQAEQERKAKQEELRLLARKEREAEAQRLIDERLARAAAAEAQKTARLQAEQERKAQQEELRLLARKEREAEAQRHIKERMARAADLEAKKVAQLQAERDRKARQEEVRLLGKDEREARREQTQQLNHLKNNVDAVQAKETDIEEVKAQANLQLLKVQAVVGDAPTQYASEEIETRVVAQKTEGQEDDTSRGGTLASPLARVLAREFGLDISTIPATGAGGRVTADDVRNAWAPEEAAPEIDQTVDYFFADVADEMKDDGK
jgi:e3 binding domain